jgi:hypothetical protein
VTGADVDAEAANAVIQSGLQVSTSSQRSSELVSLYALPVASMHMNG